MGKKKRVPEIELPYIHEQLRSLAVPIEQLTPDPDNARRHPDRNRGAIEGSLRQYGQRKPVVVQKEGMIVRAGNGTLEAAQALGWTHIAAVVVDEDQRRAMGFALADNRSGELAEWDYTQLSQLLGQLREVPDVSLTDLWTEVELDQLLDDGGGWDPPPLDPADVDPVDPADDTYTVKIDDVPAAQKDDVVKLINEALSGAGVELAAVAY